MQTKNKGGSGAEQGKENDAKLGNRWTVRVETYARKNDVPSSHPDVERTEARIKGRKRKDYR